MAPLFDYDSHRKGPSTPVRRSIRIAKQLQSGEELDLLSKLEEEDGEGLPPNHHAKPKGLTTKSSLRWPFSSYSAPADESFPGTPTRVATFPFSTQSQPARELSIRALDFENTNVISKEKVMSSATEHRHENNNVFENSSSSLSDSSSFSEKSSSSDSMIFLKTPKVPFNLWLRRSFSQFSSYLAWPYNVSLRFKPLMVLFIIALILLLSIRHLYKGRSRISYDFPVDLNGIKFTEHFEKPITPPQPSSSFSSASSSLTYNELLARTQELERIVTAVVQQQHQFTERFFPLAENYKASYDQLDKIQSEFLTVQDKFEAMSSKLNLLDRDIVSRSEFELKLSSLVSQFNVALLNTSQATSEMFSELKSQIPTQDIPDTNRHHLRDHSHEQPAQPDYALYSLGAKPLFIHSSDTLHVLNSFISRHFGVGVIGKAHFYALLPGVVPGNCWCFNGNRGNFSFSIPRAIAPSSFSIDHPSSATLANRSSAPRKIELWASSDVDLESTDNIFVRLFRKISRASSTDPWDSFLGAFEYDIDGLSTQTFAISTARGLYTAFQLRILDNWGKIEYTCLYKIRLHSSN